MKRKVEKSPTEKSQSTPKKSRITIARDLNQNIIQQSQMSPRNLEVKDGIRSTIIKIPNELSFKEFTYVIENANNLRNIRAQSELFDTDKLNKLNEKKEQLFGEFTNKYFEKFNTPETLVIPSRAKLYFPGPTCFSVFLVP